MTNKDAITELHFVCTDYPGPADECVFVELENQDGRGLGPGVSEWKDFNDGYKTLVVPYTNPEKAKVIRDLLEEFQFCVKEYYFQRDFDGTRCPDCGRSSIAGHTDDCRIRLALS